MSEIQTYQVVGMEIFFSFYPSISNICANYPHIRCVFMLQEKKGWDIFYKNYLPNISPSYKISITRNQTVGI